MKIERTKNASKNIIFGFVLRLFQLFIPFVIRTAMIKYMGVEYLGLNGLFTSILQILNLAELGVGSAMVYSMYKPISRDDTKTICALIKLYKYYYLIIGGIIAVVGIMITPMIPLLIKSDMPKGINIYVVYLFNLSITVCSYWMFAYKNSLFQAHQRIDIISKISFATMIFQYGMQLMVIVATRNYYLYVLVSLISQFLTNIVTAIVATKMYPQYKPKGYLEIAEKKKITNNIMNLFTAKLGGVIVSSADSVVISAVLGLNILAIYQNYYYILSAVASFVIIIFNSCMAGIGNSLIVETKEKNYNDFKKFLFLLSWLMSVFTSCMLCMYQPFIKIWLGEKYLLSFGCVVLLCVYFYIFVIQQYFCTYKDAAGIWREDRFRPLVSALVNLGLNLLLVQKWGIYAIILSTVISYLVIAMPWLVYNLFGVLFKRSPKQYIKLEISYVITTVMSCIVSYLACCILPNGKVFNLLVIPVLCFCISSFIFFLVYNKKTEFVEAMNILNNVTNCRFSKIFECLGRRGDNIE